MSSTNPTTAEALEQAHQRALASAFMAVDGAVAQVEGAWAMVQYAMANEPATAAAMAQHHSLASARLSSALRKAAMYSERRCNC